MGPSTFIDWFVLFHQKRRTPLHYAAMNDCLETARLLLSHRANIEAKDEVNVIERNINIDASIAHVRVLIL